MGGNVTAISKSGKQTKAEKIPIKTIGRQKFVKVIQDLLKQINKDFKKLFKTELWTDEKQIANGFVFNGSTSFIMNPEIPDEEIILFRKGIHLLIKQVMICRKAGEKHQRFSFRTHFICPIVNHAAPGEKAFFGHPGFSSVFLR